MGYTHQKQKDEVVITTPPNNPNGLIVNGYAIELNPLTLKWGYIGEEFSSKIDAIQYAIKLNKQ